MKGREGRNPSNAFNLIAMVCLGRHGHCYNELRNRSACFTLGRHAGRHERADKTLNPALRRGFGRHRRACRTRDCPESGRSGVQLLESCSKRRKHIRGHADELTHYNRQERRRFHRGRKQTHAFVPAASAAASANARQCVGVGGFIVFVPYRAAPGDDGSNKNAARVRDRQPISLYC